MWERTAAASVAQELHQRRVANAAGARPIQSSVIRAVASKAELAGDAASYRRRAQAMWQ